MNKLQGESKAAGSRPHFRDAALEPGSEHPVRGHRAVGSRSILDGGPWDTPSTVPCLGHSSAQGPPLAVVCPGGPRTSPGWRARSSRSPGCRRSCARGCRCLSAHCSSPGWGWAESSARVTPCCPEAYTGWGGPAGDRGWGRRKRSSSLFRMWKASEGGPALGLLRPPTRAGTRSLPCPPMPAVVRPWVQAQAGVPTSLPHTHPVSSLSPTTCQHFPSSLQV